MRRLFSRELRLLAPRLRFKLALINDNLGKPPETDLQLGVGRPVTRGITPEPRSLECLPLRDET